MEADNGSKLLKKHLPIPEIAKQLGVPEKTIIKYAVLDAVKKGMSFRQASIKYNVYISTVDFWCKNAGIKSDFEKQELKATDEQILKAVKKNNVMTVKRLEQVFGYQANTARKRLMRLVNARKLEYIVIGGGGKAAPLFKDFVDKRIYYIKEEDLKKWLKTKFLKDMPRNLKVAISHKLHRDSGINLRFDEEPKKRSLLLNQKTYERIKQKAVKSGITIGEYVEKKVAV